MTLAIAGTTPERVAKQWNAALCYECAGQLRYVAPHPSNEPDTLWYCDTCKLAWQYSGVGFKESEGDEGICYDCGSLSDHEGVVCACGL